MHELHTTYHSLSGLTAARAPQANAASSQGGGVTIAALQNADAHISNCMFIGNRVSLWLVSVSGSLYQGMCLVAIGRRSISTQRSVPFLSCPHGLCSEVLHRASVP